MFVKNYSKQFFKYTSVSWNKLRISKSNTKIPNSQHKHSIKYRLLSYSTAAYIFWHSLCLFESFIRDRCVSEEVIFFFIDLHCCSIPSIFFYAARLLLFYHKIYRSLYFFWLWKDFFEEYKHLSNNLEIL